METRITLVLVALTSGLIACTPPSGESESQSLSAGPMPAGAPAQLALDGPQVRTTVDEWYLEAGGGCRLYVREFGRGDTVVVVHGGFGAEHGYMLDAVAGLEHRFHFVFYDQRGSLRSPCPDSLISVQRHVADLERLRQQLDLSRLDLFGHSMGTFIAMRYLQAYPSSTGVLALAGPQLPHAPEADEELNLYRTEQREFVEWAEARASEERAAHGLDRADSLLSDRQRTHKWRIGFAAGNIFDVSRWHLLKGGQVFFSRAANQASARTMGRWDFDEELSGHDRPVTLLLGDHDLIGFGARLHRRMVDQLPGENVELIVIDSAGHNAWVDRPRRFRALLTQALTADQP